MMVEDFETFAARHGAGRQGFGDAGMHRRGERHSDKTWNRALRAQWSKDEELQARRDDLRAEYDRLVEAGEIRPPTYRERLEATAAGNPDNESTRAAIRLMKKKGWMS